jgi:hypothetical protein
VQPPIHHDGVPRRDPYPFSIYESNSAANCSSVMASTLIEVKRSSDTRIRREAVGQMLDYAANAVAYWPVEAIRARFEEACRQRGTEPAGEVEALAGPGTGVEDFWQRVKTNLQAGRVRMVFVADVIPPELRRVVEFLNGQMDPAEVLAVEIKQFVGPGLQTLVPRVIGRTAEAERKKGGPAAAERPWDEASFFTELTRQRGEREAEAARAILAWAKQALPRVWWGSGSKFGSFYPMLDLKGEKNWVVSVWTYGRVEIPFQWMQARQPFADEARRQELRGRLNAIPGVEIPADAIARRPTVPLSALTDPAALRSFLGVWDWYVAEVKAAAD